MISRSLMIVCLMIPAALAAQEQADVDSILEEFQQAGEELTSFTASFRQIEVDEFGDELIKRGSIYFLAPGRYLLVTRLDGKVLEELGKNDEDAWRTRHHVKTIDHVDVKSGGSIEGGYSFSDADDLRSSFDLTLAGVDELESGEAWHLVGMPKEDKGIVKFEVWINTENPSPVVKMKATKKYSTETIIFSDIKRNIEIDPERFVYKELSGYSVYER